MNMFNDREKAFEIRFREKAFEIRFAEEEDLRFKAKARRDHLTGIWAARQLGLVGKDAEAYAKAIVALDLEKPGSDTVFEKLRAEF